MIYKMPWAEAGAQRRIGKSARADARLQLGRGARAGRVVLLAVHERRRRDAKVLRDLDSQLAGRNDPVGGRTRISLFLPITRCSPRVPDQSKVVH